MTRIEETYDLALLERSVAKWRRSAVLRLVYADLFAGMMAEAKPGDTLEIGAGIGRIKEFYPEIVTSDVRKTRFVDRAVSCYAIHLAEESWGNIFALDVLHHLCRPMAFFASAAEALLPGGRIVLVEPAASLFGGCFYRYLHHEPCRVRDLTPPFEFQTDDASGNFANMGMAEALFRVHRPWADQQLAALGLRIVRVSYRDVMVYASSGGYSKPSLLPLFVARGLLRLEHKLPEGILSRLGLRVLVVIEKNGGGE